MRVERPDGLYQTVNTMLISKSPETDVVGLPLANCNLPAPWSTPPQKTYKQVNKPKYHFYNRFSR